MTQPSTRIIVLGAGIAGLLFTLRLSGKVARESVQITLVDEADTFLRNSDELRGVLNAGHTRASAVVIRTVGDEHEPRTFSVWCPKAMTLRLWRSAWYRRHYSAGSIVTVSERDLN